MRSQPSARPMARRRFSALSVMELGLPNLNRSTRPDGVRELTSSDSHNGGPTERPVTAIRMGAWALRI